MAKARTIWRCGQCGHDEPKWAGRCSSCGEYGTFTEEAAERSASSSRRVSAPQPVRIADVETAAGHRLPTGVPEFDRVLGGGLVRGSLVLLGGEPGIGKSTLLLQVADALARAGSRVLYVCGEESPEQVKMRAERLGDGGDIGLLPVTDVVQVEAAALEDHTDVLVIDSIQTMVDPDAPGSPGSVGQVRAATARLMRVAKDRGITTLLVGHVTKEGAIAGPRVLEHMVDTVLYFEGDSEHAFRIVRAAKNRFGSVSEIGVFEMGEAGLVGVANPSAALLQHRPSGVSGSAVMAAMEGSRPVLVEIQALVSPSYLQMPRRLATGIESQRLLQVLAVLERRAGLPFGQHDVYVSVAGGVRISEPAIDLPLALALASARKDVALPASVASFGEIGLAGEVRPVAHASARAGEAAALGLSLVITGPSRGLTAPAGAELRTVAFVTEALSALGL
ncbi:MAG: DNA repair protein RadA [Coriobacteriia bacterium]|nr:DNA repair protein RadA [Coriobacteriia bacterium]